MKPRILVVEDELSHQMIVRKALGEIYDVDVVDSVAQAQVRINQGPHDLYLLDIMLGDGDGYQVLTYLREFEASRLAPVIFLTAKEDLRSKILGLTLGADDYVTKPCDPLELRARIDAKLRRHAELKAMAQNAQQFNVGGLSFDSNRQVIRIQSESESLEIELTPLEYRLLSFLAKNHERPVARAEILKYVWGESTHVLERSVDTYVAALRRKLGPRAKVIKSVHGVGYRFVPAPASSRAA